MTMWTGYAHIEVTTATLIASPLCDAGISVTWLAWALCPNGTVVMRITRQTSAASISRASATIAAKNNTLIPLLLFGLAFALTPLGFPCLDLTAQEPQIVVPVDSRQ